MKKNRLSPQEERTLQVGDEEIAFIRTGGSRTAVLLIHGNSSFKEIFEHQIAFLADRGHDVVAADLPGHGNSSNAAKPRSTYSFPGYASALRSLMKSLGIGAYHTVGWSLGGHIGIEMWRTDPAVRSLLITGTPPVRLSTKGASEGFLPSLAMGLAGKRILSDEDILSYGRAMLGEPLDPNGQIARCIARTDGNARRWMVENGFAGIGCDQVDAVAHCPKPLAIVQGKNDPFVNLAHLRGLTYQNLWLKNPAIVTGGHALHWQCSTEFNRYLGEFITN